MGLLLLFGSTSRADDVREKMLLLLDDCCLLSLVLVSFLTELASSNDARFDALLITNTVPMYPAFKREYCHHQVIACSCFFNSWKKQQGATHVKGPMTCTTLHAVFSLCPDCLLLGLHYAVFVGMFVIALLSLAATGAFTSRLRVTLHVARRLIPCI